MIGYYLQFMVMVFFMIFAAEAKRMNFTRGNNAALETNTRIIFTPVGHFLRD